MDTVTSTGVRIVTDYEIASQAAEMKLWIEILAGRTMANVRR